VTINLKKVKTRGGVLLGFTQLRRLWRLAEMRLLFLALLVAVVAVTSVGFFTDRADRAMTAQATQLLGGDLVVVSTRPIDKAFLNEAEKQGIQTAQTVSFPSMVSVGEKFQLAQVKAVSKQYPLHGAIEITRDHGKTLQEARISELGSDQAIAESRLFVSLGIKPKDSVQLGRIKIELSSVIQKMPDQASSAFQLAPTLILPLQQLAGTGLLGPASRASYSFFFAGNEEKIQSFKQWLKPQLASNERLRTLDDGLPTIQKALERGQRFLKMASLLAVILAGAGIALSSFSLMHRETSAVAVLKTLGASRKQILMRYLSQLLFIATVATVIGSVMGYFIQFLLANYLQDFVGQTLPDAGWWPVVIGLLTAWIMVLGFSASQLAQLVSISPIQILQGQTNRSKSPKLLAFVTISIGIFLLMWLQTNDIKLSLILLLSVLVALALFWFIATILLSVIRKLSQRWRLPRANRRMVLLVVVFGIGIFSLLLLTTLRGDLIQRWQASLPEKAPNHFLINIQPDEVKPIQSLLAKDNIETPLYPMTLGRLTKINGELVSPDDEAYAENERAQRLLIREFNLSATSTLPEDNEISSGEWFKPKTEKGYSVEEGIAKTLGLKLGDSITFDIAGQLLKEEITSLRTVKWDSMKPNFFVITAPKALADKPQTFITSIHIDENKKEVLPALISQFPSVTDIDVSAILAQVRDLIEKASLAVQAIFIFTLISGVVVLFSALQSQKAMRRKEIAILKTLGASRAYLRKSLLLEFIMIGGLAGFLAASLALLVGNLAAYQLFDLSPEVNFSVLFIGTALGASLVGAAGYFNVRSLLSVLPASLFR